MLRLFGALLAAAALGASAAAPESSSDRALKRGSAASGAMEAADLTADLQRLQAEISALEPEVEPVLRELALNRAEYARMDRLEELSRRRKAARERAKDLRGRLNALNARYDEVKTAYEWSTAGRNISEALGGRRSLPPPVDLANLSALHNFRRSFLTVRVSLNQALSDDEAAFDRALEASESLRRTRRTAAILAAAAVLCAAAWLVWLRRHTR